MVVVEGTVRLALLFDRETRLPPTGAAVVRVTVQVAVPADDREEGLQATEVI